MKKPKKPIKVEVKQGALDAIPEAERAGVMEEVRKLFENFDPKNPPGERIAEVDKSATACPRCGGKFVEVTVVAGKRFLDCEACDATFMQVVDA